MTAKEYLQQIRMLDIKIRQWEEERDRLMSEATSTGSRKLKQDIVQTSINGDQVSRTVERCIDLDARITRAVSRLRDLRAQIISEIQSLPNPQHVAVLDSRYVRLNRFEQIAVDMNFTIRRVYQLHGDALQAFEHFILFHKNP